MMRKIFVVLLMLALVFTLAACGSGSGSGGGGGGGGGGGQAASEGPQYGGMVRIAGGADLNSVVGVPWDLFPAVTQSVPWADSFFYETPAGDYIGCLAESWEVDADNAEVRIKLREGINFTDGSPYNAEVAAWNLNTQVASGKIFYSFKGAEARSEYEVAILLEFFWNGFFPTMSTHCYSHISMENYEKNGLDYARLNAHGTGPFMVDEVVPGSHARYIKSQTYRDPAKPYLDAVEIVFMPDAISRAAAMSSTGDDAVDVVQTNLGEQVMQIVATGAPVNVMTSSGGSINLYTSSANADSPFAKYEVRKAVAFAIDRQALCDARGFGILTPATQMIAPGYVGHEANANYVGYDPALAKDLLNQAGYPNGFSTTLYSTSSVDRDIVVAMQSMLEEVGIRATLEFPESGAATELRNGGWEGMFAHPFTCLANTVDSFYLHYDIYDQFNVSTFRPPTMESAYLEARLTEKIDQELVALMQKITLDEMQIIPVHYTYTNYLLRNNLHDSGFGEWSTGTVWIPENAWKSQ